MHDLEEENVAEMGDVKKVRDRALAAARFKQRLAFECLVFTLYISVFLAVLMLRRNLPANLQMTSAVEAALHAEIEPSSGAAPSPPPQPAAPARRPSPIHGAHDTGAVGRAGNRYTFDGITTLAQTWAWLQGPLQQTLFPPTPFYAGGAANYSEVASHLVLGQLALVGAVRIKQWRVRPDVSCPPRLPGFARPCYGVLRAGAEASEAFGPNAGGGHGGLAGFSLARENVTKQDSAIDGFFYTYGPRAYVLDLATWPRAHGTTASTPPPHARTAATLEAYRQHGWLDAATRGVSVMFTLYNGNTQILLAVQALFEVSPAGRVVPTLALQAFDRDPMLMQGASSDAPGPKRAAFALMVINCLLFLVAVRKKAAVIRELLAESASPLSAALKFLLSWHTVDMYVLCLFFVSFCVRLAVFNLFPSLDARPAEATEYIDYFPLAQYIQYGFNLDALILLGATLKTAKYLQLFQEDHMIARVFSFAASDLGFVLALYALLYAAFVILAQQIFGPSLVAFRSPRCTRTARCSISPTLTLTLDPNPEQVHLHRAVVNEPRQDDALAGALRCGAAVGAALPLRLRLRDVLPPRQPLPRRRLQLLLHRARGPRRGAAADARRLPRRGPAPRRVEAAHLPAAAARQARVRALEGGRRGGDGHRLRAHDGGRLLLPRGARGRRCARGRGRRGGRGGRRGRRGGKRS